MRYYLAHPYPVDTYGTFEVNVHRRPVRLLLSYAYVKSETRVKPPNFPGFNVRDWVLDSGAYTVSKQTGKSVDHQEYMEYVRTCGAREVFGLDVIGDPQGTRQNLEREWRAGLDTIPTVHWGNWDPSYIGWAKSGPTGKIAVGGLTQVKGPAKFEFLSYVFRTAWPCRIHGLGIGSRDAVLTFPFDTVDSTSWQMGALCFDTWRVYNGLNLKTPGSYRSLWNEIERIQSLEDWATAVWRPLWERVADKLPPTNHWTEENRVEDHQTVSF